MSAIPRTPLGRLARSWVKETKRDGPGVGCSANSLSETERDRPFPFRENPTYRLLADPAQLCTLIRSRHAVRVKRRDANSHSRPVAKRRPKLRKILPGKALLQAEDSVVLALNTTSQRTPEYGLSRALQMLKCADPYIWTIYSLAVGISNARRSERLSMAVRSCDSAIYDHSSFSPLSRPWPCHS